jgi:hypothetical protein
VFRIPRKIKREGVQAFYALHSRVLGSPIVINTYSLQEFQFLLKSLFNIINMTFGKSLVLLGAFTSTTRAFISSSLLQSNKVNNVNEDVCFVWTISKIQLLFRHVSLPTSSLQLKAVQIFISPMRLRASVLSLHLVRNLYPLHLHSNQSSRITYFYSRLRTYRRPSCLAVDLLYFRRLTDLL